MKRGTNTYLAASFVGQAAALVRYAILARLLGPEQLGLAATLILTAQFFESLTDMGADRFIVQDARGDTPEVQKLVQLAMAVRGFAIAAALALTSGFVAGLLDARALAPSLVVLGLAPLIGGLINLDLRRFQRTGDFRAEALSIILSEVAATAATAAAAWGLRDHTAAIYGLVARAAVQVLVSHATANRLYGWSFVKEHAVRFSTFAGPLMINGVLVFLGSQGDRLIVGSAVGATALGHYSAVLLLVFYPASAVSRFVMSLHMPLVAASREDPAAFAAMRGKLAGRTILLAVALMLGFSLVGPVVTPLLYGRNFAQPALLFAALAFLQASRMLRFWPTTLALGTGDSVTVLVNNIVRIAALPVTLGAYAVWPSIYTIVGGFAIGELLAQFAALLLLARRGVIEAGVESQRTALFILLGLATCAMATEFESRGWLLGGVAGATLILLLAILIRRERPVITEALDLARRRLIRV